MRLIDNLQIWILCNIKNGEYRIFSKDYFNTLYHLIDIGYLEKVKCNNAPNDLEVIDNCISGVFNVTELGKTWLEFKEL